jgi:hypothetical protein
MSAIDHADGSVVWATWIEMKPDRQHLLEYSGRGLHVRNTGFLGPRAIAWQVDAVLNSDGEILVPDDFPVRVRCLVEKQCPNRNGGLAEYGRGESPERGSRGECGDTRIV